MTELESVFTNIATAIRSKASVSTAFKPSEMATGIINIPERKLSVIPPVAYMSSTITQYTGNEEAVLDYAFSSCSSLSKVTLSKCFYVGNYAFYRCSSLSSIIMPECTYIGIYGFRENKFSTLSFSKCKYIDSGAFWNCKSLTTASFPQCSYIGDMVFIMCSSLSSLYLLSTSLVTLSNSNAFSNTPLSAGGSGKIYVPKSLFNAYKTATNWSYVSARLVSV